ncbi:unnamed protein product [Ceutorhynchus assimilis]|uniref:Uncharacterized protein n=1 Tax=Ceutorhynchus assimilis TaxID=467358 RepID=A0A9P0DPQ4_9CUCU|nr:unnamed protein product [Ceutorhynchus assimilis]
MAFGVSRVDSSFISQIDSNLATLLTLFTLKSFGFRARVRFINPYKQTCSKLLYLLYKTMIEQSKYLK